MPLHALRISRRIEVKLVRQMLKFSSSDAVCDVGCGDGYWTQKISRGKLTVGIDIDAASLAKARDGKYARGVAYTKTSVTAMPFSSNRFDKIFGICSIEHVPDNEAAFAEMGRCLKPGGELVLTLDSLTFPGTTEAQRKEHDRKYFTPHLYDVAYAKECLGKAGLELTEHRYIICSALSHGIYRIIDRQPRIQYLLFPILYPLILWSDGRERSPKGGWKLAIKAVKRG